MLDFDIKSCSRRCAATDRELLPGETYYSVLVPVGSDVVRRDYCAEAWTDPPDDAVAWWRSQMPEANAKKMQVAPSDVLLSYFEQLEGQAEKADARYVLALLLIRRRIARLETTETDEQGLEQLVLFCPRTETEYRTPVIMPSDQRAAEIQNELGNLLFNEAA